MDLILVCGGLLWLLAGVHAGVKASSISEPPHASSALLLVGALIFTDTHFGTSYMQALGKSTPWCKRFCLPVILIMASAALIACFPDLVTNGCKLYLSVVVLHYVQQIINLLQKYSDINAYRWTRYQKLAIVTLIYSLAIHALLDQLFFRQMELSTFLGIAMPHWPLPPAWTIYFSQSIACLSTTALVAFTVARAATERTLCPMPIWLLLMTTAIIFTIRGDMSHDAWIYVPAFLHGTQSIAVTLHSCRLSDGRGIDWQAAAWLLIPGYVLGATIMFLSAPLLARFTSPQLSYPSIVLAASAFHFLCDYTFVKRDRSPKLHRAS